MRNAAVRPRRHDEQRIGEALERTIAELLRQANREPTTAEILAAASEEPLQRLPDVYRLAARQKLITGVTIYFRSLALDPAEWQFVGHQVPLAHLRGDLLFESRSGGFLLDELKSGVLVTPDDSRLAIQIAAQLAAGAAIHGDRFLGVRALFLSALPNRS